MKVANCCIFGSVHSRTRFVLPVAVATITLASACGSSSPERLSNVGALPTPASAWPAALHDANHSASSTAVGPQAALVRWTRHLEGDVTPGPVIGVDGSVVAASNAGVLHDLDPSTGHDRWTYDAHGRYGSDLSTSPAVLQSGEILWPGPAEKLYALTRAGALEWSVAFPGQPLSPAVAGNQRIYVSDGSGHLSAIDTSRDARHRLLWRLRFDTVSYGSAAVAPDGLIYVTGDRKLVAVTDRGSTGHVEWSFRTHDTIEVSPAATPDSDAIVGTNNDREYGVTPNGKQLWAYSKNAFTYSSAAAPPDGDAVFGDHHGQLNVLDAHGRLLHSDRTSPPATDHGAQGIGVWTAPVLDGHGDAYFGTAAGHIYGFSTRGAQLWDLRAGSTVDSYPALGADGALYIGAANGILYAIGEATN